MFNIITMYVCLKRIYDERADVCIRVLHKKKTILHNLHSKIIYWETTKF